VTPCARREGWVPKGGRKRLARLMARGGDSWRCRRKKKRSLKDVSFKKILLQKSPFMRGGRFLPPELIIKALMGKGL